MRSESFFSRLFISLQVVYRENIRQNYLIIQGIRILLTQIEVSPVTLLSFQP